MLINWLNLAFFENIWLVIATISCYFEPNSSHPGELAITTLTKNISYRYTFQGKTEKEDFITICFELFHSIRKKYIMNSGKTVNFVVERHQIHDRP